MKYRYSKLRSRMVILMISLVTAGMLFTACAGEVQNSSLKADEKPGVTDNATGSKNGDISGTVENTKEKVVESWEEYAASNLPLIAAIPDKNIFLYGVKPGGVVLYVEGTGHYYEWDYMTPRFMLPKMYSDDFDADGKAELAIILYTGSGTGYAVEDLHMVEIAEDEVISRDPASKDYFKPNPEYFSDHFFKPEDYEQQLDKLVALKTYEKDGKLRADITIDSTAYTVNLKELQSIEQDITINDKAVFGNIVFFNLINGKLTAEFAFGVTSTSFAAPFEIGKLYADVDYSEDRFLLTNLRFEPDEEFPAE